MMTSTPAIEPRLLPGPIGIIVFLTSNLSLTRVGRLLADDPPWNIAPSPATNIESCSVRRVTAQLLDHRRGPVREDQVVDPLDAGHGLGRVDGRLLPFLVRDVRAERPEHRHQRLVAAGVPIWAGRKPKRVGLPPSIFVIFLAISTNSAWVVSSVGGVTFSSANAVAL